MLSIVPLMHGGGLFETGAGGSAPKHVQQFEQENHLRWDSLGEFLALAASFEHFATVHGDAVAGVFGSTLDEATSAYLMNNKGPSRRGGEPDNRATHYWVARYWAEALASQTDDAGLASRFAPLAASLADAEAAIMQEMVECQGPAQDIGGYFQPDEAQAVAAMRPSDTFNTILEGVAAAAC
jgi:isocitrate dehydrogenase